MVPLFGNMLFFFMRLPMSSLRVRPRVLVLRQSEIDAYGFTPILTFPRRGGRLSVHASKSSRNSNSYAPFRQTPSRTRREERRWE
jgi:hypothetical protein